MLWSRPSHRKSGWKTTPRTQVAAKTAPEVRAITILLRDHVRSDNAGEACRRMSYGFRKECETFLRKLAETNPQRDVRGLACLRLAQFLNGRLQRLDLLTEQPELANRYEGLFGKAYLAALRQQDRAQGRQGSRSGLRARRPAVRRRATSLGGTVGEKANSERIVL